VVDVIGVIDDIKSYYHRDWEKQKLAFAHEFLSRTWAGIPLPVLSVCGRGTQEIRYSTYLAYFIDGTKKHGLGTRYLDGILARLQADGVDTFDSVVETEKWLGLALDCDECADCRCDIVVSCRQSGHVVFIEQKINSGESPSSKMNLSQLQRYDLAIKGNSDFPDASHQVRVFLTPDGKKSPKSPLWHPLSYHDLVDVGMDVLHTGGISTTARENLRRFLIDLSLGPLGKAESELDELVEFAVRATTGKSFMDRLRFDQAHTRNRVLVELLMEG